MSEENNRDLANIDDEAENAASEVIRKVTGAAVDGLIDLGSNLAGGLFGDRIREWRTRNMISCAAETARFLREMGVPLEKAKSLKMGQLYGLFEGASICDEPEVRDLYAGLLANSMDPNSSHQPNSDVISVLKQLSPRDTAVLEILRILEEQNLELFRWSSKQRPKKIVFDENGKDEKIAEFSRLLREFKLKNIEHLHDRYIHFELDDEAANSASLQNLIRLGCITVASDYIETASVERLVESREISGQRDRAISVINPQRAIKILNQMRKSIEKQSHNAVLPDHYNKVIIFDTDRVVPLVTYTNFGRRLVECCTVKTQNQ